MKTIQLGDYFSSLGFRTLCFAMKNLDIFLKEDNSNIVEYDMQLLGITAVEDLLQSDVSNCVEDFKEAGIKVWMLTGDKSHTALEIAK